MLLKREAPTINLNVMRFPLMSTPQEKDGKEMDKKSKG